jgi:hypothetical protein
MSQVSQISYCHLAYVLSQTKLSKTPQKTGFEEDKSFDKEYKSFSMEKTTQKSILEGNAPLYTIRECQCYVPSFGGALQCSVPHFEGALALFE